MISRPTCSVRTATVLLLATLAVGHHCLAANPHDLAKEILKTSGVQGGLVVHVGCDDGKLTGALCTSDCFLVHGLDDAAHVAAARQYLQKSGLYGRVSVESWSGPELPYIDNAVNLLVIRQSISIARDQILRVLCPGGTALTVSTGDDAGIVEQFTKPRSDQLDDWTHYLHDATGNAVARDNVVGPPKHLQWVGSPTWTRHHDHISSFHAMVSSGGRVFYLMDEGPRAEIQLPPQWKLSARDAFNGCLLWQRSIDDWHSHLWPLKSGPAQLPRRLVAVEDRVYVTLGLNAPISVLDAASGETLRELDATAATEEILYDDGQLLAVVHENPQSRPWTTMPSYARYDQLQAEPNTWSWKTDPRTITALEEETGEVLWKHQSPVAPLTLATDGVRVMFHDGTKVVCLDKRTGQSLWSSQPIERAADMRSWFAPTLVVHQGVVVFAGGESVERHRGGQDTMTALSAETGELLWTAEHPPSGYDSPEDVLIVDGLVWTAPITNRRDSGLYTGRDLRTGQVKRTFPADDGDHMPHHRCHRAKATERFLLTSRTGIEYVDLQAEHWNRNDWVRGACLYGIMPANGLTYAPPQSCACYIVSKLNGLNALAPARAGDDTPPDRQPQPRLEKGPAYASASSSSSSLVLSSSSLPSGSSSFAAADWPTYRSDAARTGWAKTPVPSSLSLTWRTDIGGRLSSPVIADGRVYVASIDRHTVHALDQRTGTQLWQAIAGARVDSPPTIWRDRVLFGSHDGWVYCLRADDGELAWRYRAAPDEQRLVAFEQVESVWPVHGSVLVQDGIVHCVAGRSMFLDGGMRYVRLDASTGELLSETVLDDRHPETGEPLDAEIRWPNLPVALPDILSCDGESVYMRSQRFDLQGRRVDVAAASDFKDQTGEGAHLFATTGFLDDSWWHRTYWMYGKSALGGAGGWYLPAYRAPTGRIMVCDDAEVYAFDRQPQYYPKTTALEYHLYAADKRPEIVAGRAAAQSTTSRNRPAPSRPAYDWSYQTPLLGRALVLADRTVFVAGPPDLVQQEQSISSLDDPKTQKRLADQAAALAGRRGALLMAVSADSGAQLAAYRLPSPPVFDGLAAASGHLYLSAMDGSVSCLGSEGKPLPTASDVRLTDRPEPTAGVSGRGVAVRFTSKHPDFQKLTRIQVDMCDLGYRLRTPGGSVGYALKKLPKPLTDKTTFKLRLVMLPNPGKRRPPGNGFLAFGAAPDDASLIKCGLRNAGGVGVIVQGPLLQGESATKPVPCDTEKLIELAVHVDLDQQTIQMQCLGQTITAELADPLNEITYIGYGVHSVASEFSPIQIAAD